MKIVHFENFFFPKAGYQVNVLAKLQARMGHEVIIMAAENKRDFNNFKLADMNEEADRQYTESTGVKIIRLPYKRIISQRVFYKDNIVKKVNELNADILLAHDNDSLSSMIFTCKHKKLNCPIVLDSHMLEMAATNKLSNLFRKVYKAFISKIIIKNQFKVIRTQDDDYVMKWYGIPKDLAPLISFGSDLTLFHKDEKIKKDFRKAHNINENDFVVVYTGKLDASKGGQILADAFLEKFNTDKNITLVVVGNYVGEYGAKVKETLLNSKNNIVMFPTQSYVDLPQFYQCADLSIFPKQCSLSFYDAQACGLPVLSEDNNVNIDRCSHNNGSNFKSGDVNDFRIKLEEYFNMNSDDLNIMSENAVKFIEKNYNYEDITKEYNKIFELEINNQKSKIIKKK